MFQDVSVSKELNDQFRDHLKKTSEEPLDSEYLHYRIHDKLSVLQYPWNTIIITWPQYSNYITVPLMQYPHDSIHEIESISWYSLCSIHNSEEQRQCKQHSFLLVTCSNLKAFVLWWSCILLQESPWITPLLMWADWWGFCLLFQLTSVYRF